MRNSSPAADVLQRLWFHTSTHEDWPSNSWDPTAGWQPEAFKRMECMLGPGAVERWSEKQLRRCLHLGTYRAAIENMLRRKRNQADKGVFHLYRVRLNTEATIHPRIISDPGGFVGDVLPEDIMHDEESVACYVNEHEDRGSISLAVRRKAIAAVQAIALPHGREKDEHLAALDKAEWRTV